MILAEVLLGLEVFGTTWWIVAIILSIIGLVVAGYFYDSSDGPLIVLEGLCVIGLCIFWPFILIITIGVGIVSIPIILGKYARNGVNKRKEKKKEKLEFLNKVDKFKSEKL